MKITEIKVEELCRMEGKEGLVLQGCGGDLTEWVEGINEIFTEEGILKNGSKFEDVFIFRNGGLICLLYPFGDVELEMGKLAMWRLRTHENFGGTWLSDYVEDQLGGFRVEPEKPDCALIGQDGNVFNLVGIARRTLKECGRTEQASEMEDRVFASGSYSEALNIISEYVNIISSDGQEQEYSAWQQAKGAETPERSKPQKQQGR